MKLKYKLLVFIPGPLVLLAVLYNCLEPEKKDNVIAQVENAILTLKELESNFPAEYSNLVSKEQYLDFVKRWVDEEVLLHEAERIKLHLEPDIKNKIREARKKIIVEEFLSREGAGFSYTPDESAIRQYYESNSQSLLRTEPEIKYAVIVLSSLSSAWKVRAKIKENNFFQLQQKYSQGEKIASADELRYVRASELDGCFSNQILNIRIGGTSSPIECGDKIFLVKCIDKKTVGSLKAYEDVKEEISSVLINLRHKKHLEKMISELKSEIFFTFNPDLVPGEVKDAEEIGTY